MALSGAPERPDTLRGADVRPDSIRTVELDEITVRGRLSTHTDEGLRYNMSADSRAQSENMLQALSYVPFVQVSPEGQISVRGSNSFLIYLDGRPYDMAQTAPKAFLESLPASTIARVEVITNPGTKYNVAPGTYIINIVLKAPLVEGYAGNVAAGGSTQPTAQGSALAMVHKRKADFSLNYVYDLYGQRRQPVDALYVRTDDSGQPTGIRRTSSISNGDYHTHTLRAMFKWHIDSLNSLYADAHGRLKQISTWGDQRLWTEWPETDAQTTFYDNASHLTSGSAEANAIFRNYFRDAPTRERFSAGYHFAYNPDRRHLLQRGREGEQQLPEVVQRTSGGMAEHSASLSWLLRLPRGFSVRLSASERYRIGNTHSMSTGSADAPEITDAMRYTNSIASLSASAAGYIGSVHTSLGLGLAYDRFAMHLPDAPQLDYTRRHVYLTPVAQLFWRPNRTHALVLKYSSAITRPGVEQLNPFESGWNDISASRGNPDLKAQFAHTLSADWDFTPSDSFFIVPGLEYTHTSDAILRCTYAESGRLISSFGNFGSADSFGGSLFARWTPAQWVSLAANGSVSRRRLRAEFLGLDQSDTFFVGSVYADFTLPNHFTLGGHFGYYRNLPDPNSSQSALRMYSFYVRKSFLSGRLSLSLTANSPFNKYHHLRVRTWQPGLITEQTNGIIARGFALSVQYSFSGGRRIDLKRDRTLSSTDLSSGVD